MASPKAPLLDVSGKKSDVTLEEAIFGAEVKPHLVHETVRAELNHDRAGTRGGKSRGLVAGGRSARRSSPAAASPFPRPTETSRSR
jgi:ribosomal protein L4